MTNEIDNDTDAQEIELDHEYCVLCLQPLQGGLEWDTGVCDDCANEPEDDSE